MRFIFFVFLLLVSAYIYAQSFVGGFLPHIALSYNFNENYTFIHNLESRYPSFDNNSESTYINFERLDFQYVIEKKVGLLSKLALGYRFRINNKARNAHRLIQQLSWSNNKKHFRIGHRIMTDQTMSRSTSTEFRFRYRTKIQVPLQGQKLNVGEYYFSISNEVLGTLQSSTNDLENRIVGEIGLFINDKNKIETGLDWRVDEFVNDNTKHQLWFTMRWFKTL